jgi:hypothetical protein
MDDVTIAPLGRAAGRLAADHGIRCSVVDVRSLVRLGRKTLEDE